MNDENISGNMGMFMRLLAGDSGRRIYDFDYTTDKEQPIHSVRFTTWIDEKVDSRDTRPSTTTTVYAA
jgi:hypothetical protein